MVWEIVFMLLILKIPIVYLCVVVWWAIRAEPEHGEPTALVPVADTPSSDGGPRTSKPDRRPRRSPMRPRPGRRPARGVRLAPRADVRR